MGWSKMLGFRQEKVLDEAAVLALNEDPMRRVLFKGGCILTLDEALGDFVTGDLLIEGRQIAAVGPELSVDDAEIIDATGTILIPGLIDTHRHSWETSFRRVVPNADLIDYVNFAHLGISGRARPHDYYVANLLAGITAITSGTTSILDYSHVSRTCDEVDACIKGHLDGGARVVFADSLPPFGEVHRQWPEDMRRVKETFFGPDQKLMTLRLGATANTHLSRETILFARDLGVAISSDGCMGASFDAALPELAEQGLIGEDLTLIHGTGLSSRAFGLIKQCGAHLALATTSDAHFRGLDSSMPPIQAAIDAGLLPGLSVDNELSLSGDLFSQMRATFYFQRLLANTGFARGDKGAPRPMTVRHVLEMGTIGGARCNGLADKVGTLAIGKEADIVMIEAEDALTMPLNNAVGTVVLAADTASVRTVIIAGQIRKWEGRLIGVDLDHLRELVHESRDYLGHVTKLWTPDDIVGDGPLFQHDR